MDLDIKSFVLGALITGGVYGFYIKNMGSATTDQEIEYKTEYKQVLECFKLLDSSDSEKISAFLNTLPKKQKKLEQSDAIMTATTITFSEKLELSAMGRPLAKCAKTLVEQFERIKS